MYYYEYDHVYNAWSPQLAVAAAFMAWSLYCIWRLWVGLRLDPFDRSLRALRWEPGTRLTTRKNSNRAPRTGLLQVSLMPLMLLSTGIAILLAQAMRPDELSRPYTWTMFVLVASWYGAFAWPHLRGIGPLRNKALGAVLTATLTSLSIWIFYMAVDAWHADTSYERLKAGYGTLIWWTAAGAACGAIIGSMRSARDYRKLAPHRPDVHPSDLAATSPTTSDFVAANSVSPAINATPRKQSRIGWGAIMVGCIASLAFHVSAAPQLYQVVKVRVWHDWRYDHWHHHPSNSHLTLTMQASFNTPRLVDTPLTITPGSTSQGLELYSDSPQRLATSESTSPTDAPIGILLRDVRTGEPILEVAAVVLDGRHRTITADSAEGEALRGKVAAFDMKAGDLVTRASLASMEFLAVTENRIDITSLQTMIDRPSVIDDNADVLEQGSAATQPIIERRQLAVGSAPEPVVRSDDNSFPQFGSVIEQAEAMQFANSSPQVDNPATSESSAQPPLVQPPAPDLFASNQPRVALPNPVVDTGLAPPQVSQPSPYQSPPIVPVPSAYAPNPYAGGPEPLPSLQLPSLANSQPDVENPVTPPTGASIGGGIPMAAPPITPSASGTPVPLSESPVRTPRDPFAEITRDLTSGGRPVAGTPTAPNAMSPPPPNVAGSNRELAAPFAPNSDSAALPTPARTPNTVYPSANATPATGEVDDPFSSPPSPSPAPTYVRRTGLMLMVQNTIAERGEPQKIQDVVAVKEVSLANNPAFKGVKAGDRVISINGRSVASIREILAAIQQQQAKLEFASGLTVTLPALPALPRVRTY